VFKSRHFDRSMILLGVRWCLAYSRSLRNLEEMMAERAISVAPATMHRWTLRYASELLERLNQRARAVTGRLDIDETSVRVRGQWRSLYRAIDSNGSTVELGFSERRDLTAAHRFWGRPGPRGQSKAQTHPIESSTATIRDNLARFNRRSKRYSTSWAKLEATLLLFFNRYLIPTAER
jgi:hypothetical protein